MDTAIITDPDATGVKTPDPAADPREEVAERLFAALLGAMDLFTVHVGRQTGLYDHLASVGPTTAREVAEQTGLDHRYAVEWLDQQAATGFLEVADVDASHDQRTYELPSATADVLLDDTSPFHLGSAGTFAVGVGQVANDVANAFRTGDGVSYADYGPELRRAIAAFNRPMVEAELASTWLPAVPELHANLQAAPAPRILDIGCGLGRTTIELARALPHATVRGIDLDEASIVEARQAAADAGVADRVRFTRADAIDFDTPERFDLVASFECLHDSADPVGVLATARRLGVPGGGILVADDRGAEAFAAPADDYERLLYGFSVLHCLPATRAESGPHAHGTVVRPDDALGWFRDAGFRDARVVDVDNEMWRFYHATS